MSHVEDWGELGERVREARLAHGLSQTDLATRIEMDRTALVRVEAGERHVSALELMRIAKVLELSVGHFVTRPPAAVTSRRQSLAEDADAASRERFLLDADLEEHARHTSWLVEQGLLSPVQPWPKHDSSDREQARELARRVRDTLELGTRPITSMAELAEDLGLYLLVVDRDVEGASLLLDGFGVAVIGGRTQPGRRRSTAAHELGHHLLQDAYHTDLGVAASTDERERLIDAFAAELLLPSPVLADGWPETEDSRSHLITVSGTYRVSWTVTLAAAHRLGLIDSSERQQLHAATPMRGDLLAVLGYEPSADLEIGETGPAWRRGVLAGWRKGLLTAERTIELLHRSITSDDLPSRGAVSAGQ